MQLGFITNLFGGYPTARLIHLGLMAVIVAFVVVHLALVALFPRTRTRDVAMCGLQMWAYLATYQMPNDDPEKLEARVRVAYPVRADRAIGLGTTPTLRLQRAFGQPGHFARWEKLLVWSHWLWFGFPHGTAAYVLLRHRDQFPRAAAQIYGTFDAGVIAYWAIPTAPPCARAWRRRILSSGPNGSSARGSTTCSAI